MTAGNLVLAVRLQLLVLHNNRRCTHEAHYTTFASKVAPLHVQVYETQKVIEHESQLLRKELADFQSQLKTWTSKVTQLQATLKHVGDIEHYVCVLSRQAQALAVVLSSTQGEEQEVAQHPGDVETVVGSEPGAEQAAVADQLPVSRRAAG